MNTKELNPPGEIELKLADVATHRANLYYLMATVTRTPSINLAEDLLNGKFYLTIENCVRWINERSGVFDDQLLKLKVFAEKYNRINPEKLLNEMKEEYTRLFLDNETGSIPSHESSFRESLEKENIIYEKGLKSIEEIYRDEGGFDFLAHSELPDHITTELSFLKYLCEMESRAWYHGKLAKAKLWRRKQREFFVNYLGKLGESYFAEVETRTDLEIYKLLSSFGQTFMKLEKGY